METLDWRELMEEPPGGENFGRSTPTDDDAWGGDLGTAAAQEHESMQDGGWGVVETSRGSGGLRTQGAGDAGMSAHRGVLRGDEFIDTEAVMHSVERALGFTIDDVRAAYRNGRPSIAQRELRGRIDLRLLALSRSEANMLALARIFGWNVRAAGTEGGDHCDMMERALARARDAELLA